MAWSAKATAIIEQQIDRLIAGAIDHATARLNVLLELKQIGEWDFSDELYDRLDRGLHFNTALRQLWRQHNDGCEKVVLDLWPAQELRSWNRDDDEILRSRWRSRGGQFFSGRMIALKDDPIWTAISDFGLPYPPYAKESYGRLSAITRKEAMRLGLIDLNRQIALEKLPPPLGLK